MIVESPALAGLPGIRHAFFTRQGGVSEGIYGSLNGGLGSSDERDRVVENRARMAAGLGVGPDSLVSLHQVHSPEAVIVEAPFGTERPKADEEALELRIGHAVEQRLEVLAALGCHLVEDRVARWRPVHDDDAAIVGIPTSFDESTPLDPVDDPGEARDRHVQLVSQLRHRQRSVDLEDRQDVQVNEAQRAAKPVAERTRALARTPRGQLVEQVVEGGATRPSVAGIQCHIDNLCGMKRRRQRRRVLPV